MILLQIILHYKWLSSRPRLIQRLGFGESLVVQVSEPTWSWKKQHQTDITNYIETCRNQVDRNTPNCQKMQRLLSTDICHHRNGCQSCQQRVSLCRTIGQLWSSALILNGCPRSPWYWAAQPLKQAFAIAAQAERKAVQLLEQKLLLHWVSQNGVPKKWGAPKRGCPNVKQFIIMSPIQMGIFQGIPRFCLTKSTNHPNVAGRFLPYALYALHVRIHFPKRSRGCFATAGWLWISCRLRHPLCYWHWSEGNWSETCIFNSKFSGTNSMDPYDPYGQHMAFYTCYYIHDY